MYYITSKKNALIHYKIDGVCGAHYPIADAKNSTCFGVWPNILTPLMLEGPIMYNKLNLLWSMSTETSVVVSSHMASIQ